MTQRWNWKLEKKKSEWTRRSYNNTINVIKSPNRDIPN